LRLASSGANGLPRGFFFSLIFAPFLQKSARIQAYFSTAKYARIQAYFDA